MDVIRTKELTKNTIIITLGRISTQFVSFLLLPLYTKLLTTEEYGIVDFVATLVQLTIPVVSMMIDQGVFRYLLNCRNDNEIKNTISSGFFTLVSSCAASVFFYVVVSCFVHNSYKHWLIMILVATTFSNFFLQVARGLKSTGDYTLGSFVCSASIIVLNVLCIVAFHLKAVGILMATFLGNLICCVFLYIKLKMYKYISLNSYSKETAFEELKYSLPLVPNQISIWVMNSSDRLIVTLLLGASINGILAVSHKFPSVFLTFFNIFLLAWHETGTIHYYDPDRDVFFTDMFKKMISVFSTICMAIIVALPIVFDYLVDASYHEAFYNIPIYLIASLLNVAVGILGVVYVATKKTSEIAKTTFAAAIINIGTHLLFINSFGLFAASLSTLIGYGTIMIIRMQDVKKYVNIKYSIRQFIIICIGLSVCTFIYFLNNKIISIVFLPLFIVGAYFFNKETVNAIIQTINHKIEKRIIRKLTMFIILPVCVIATTMGGLYIYNKIVNAPKYIYKDYKGEIKKLEVNKIIRFAEFTASDFTCTGLTYDKIDNAFWIADYGANNPNDQPNPRIVEVDVNFERIVREINLYNILEHFTNLQGIAYDNKLDCIWLALGDSIKAVEKDGKLVNCIEMGKYGKFKANGICYDENNDSLWVLCASRYLLQFDRSGSVINEYSFNYYNQDHIYKKDDYIYITIGADYNGNDNFVCKLSSANGQILDLYRIIGANSLEGIYYSNKKIMILNDGLYHKDLIGHSYLAIVDVE